MYLTLSLETAEAMDAHGSGGRTPEQHFDVCRAGLVAGYSPREFRFLMRCIRILDYRLSGVRQKVDAFVIQNYRDGRLLSDDEWGPFLRAAVPQLVS